MKAPDFLDLIEFSHDGDDTLGVAADARTSEYHYVGSVLLNYDDDCKLAKFLSASKQMAAALQCPDLDAAHDALSEALETPVTPHDLQHQREIIARAAIAVCEALKAHHESRRQALLAAGFTE